MLNRFSRTELLLGADGMARLGKAHIAVIGAGAVGGYVIEALARSGIGAIDIYDDGIITEENVRYLVYASRADIGAYMADKAAERAALIDPDINIKIYKDKHIDGRSAYDSTIDTPVTDVGAAPHELAAQGLIIAGDAVLEIAKGK